MSLVKISQEGFTALKDKVVVMTGGATGIGSTVVTQLGDVGAKVVYGDLKEPDTKLSSNVEFVKTDVAEYASVLNLFKTAWSLHGHIDHVLSNAGLVEIGQLFATGDDDAAIEEAPPMLVMDVNLRGTIFVTRVGVHFLRKSMKVHQGEQKDASILLVSSVAGFGEFSGLFQYSATKHGVYGLFRSTKNFLLSTENIRVNLVLPNMTRTAMVSGVIALYESLSIPCNDTKDVGDTMLYAMSSDCSGQALYVTGAKTYELEERLEKVRPEWLGQDVYDELMAGQMALGGGGKWTKRKGGKVDDYRERALKE